MRMTGKVVGVISRLIVPDQTSEDPIDTPLVEVQWNGVQSTALLSPWELHIESAVQNTGDTPALADVAAVTPEVAEELAGSSTNHALEAESQAISQEVRDMAATVDNTSVTAVEVLEELTPEEEADRHRLEIKVDRGFYEVGCALRELKQRRLFRSTHHNWEVYCRERFQFGRDSADNKIKVAEVFENLEEKWPSIARQFLPTSERASSKGL